MQNKEIKIEVIDNCGNGLGGNGLGGNGLGGNGLGGNGFDVEDIIVDLKDFEQ